MVIQPLSTRLIKPNFCLHIFRASNPKLNIDSDKTGQKTNKQTSLKRTKRSTHTKRRAYVPFFWSCDPHKGGYGGERDPGRQTVPYSAFRFSTVCHWDFNRPFLVDDKGKPFTRIVWRSFLQVGMGRASFPVNNFNCTVVVARYKPYINMQDCMNNVLKGYFVPTGCQHVNSASSDDFILSPQRGETCLKISVFKGKMLHAGSTCTIKQLFAIFGASIRRGKQGFSFFL